MKTDEHLWHAMKAQEVLAATASRATGLTETEVATRRGQFGPNLLSRRAGDGAWLMLWRQINNPIGWLLLVSSCLAFLLQKFADAIVVLGALGVNAIIGFIQEYRAGKAIEALSALVPETANVVRDGRAVAAPASDLVPGDIVMIQSGDKVPADLRILQVKNLLVEEAALTGESLPVGKRTESVAADATVGDRVNMAYSGTMIVQGTATGVVVATGARTELGRINAMLNETQHVETPLTRQLAKVSVWITAAVVLIALVLFFYGVLVKRVPGAEALMVAITLAVAAIPEGLPAVITIALAIGVRRMAARHAIVRHLPAVETLGSTTVICSDKTGTLTRNEMTVQVVWAGGCEYRFSGVGYAPEGDVEHNGIRLAGELPGEMRELLTAAVLCNDAGLNRTENGWDIAGDPTEAALVVAGRKAGLDVDDLRTRHRRIDVIPFESDAQFMATLNVSGDGTTIHLKGAPETVIGRCTPGEDDRARVHEAVETYGREGMRVIALATAKHPDPGEHLDPAMIENGLSFLGLMGMIDPPRTEAMDAIRVCQRAGITVKMITGDHPTTAQAIGRQLGLLQSAQPAVRGRELDDLSDEQLRNVSSRASVFARVAPEHKIRLVQALQAQRHVVAMTGDGVNDAPALMQADIGVAMGITGTAVSKEAAKVILADDNFASIAAAVEEGRRVYDNLVKALAFVLPTNLGLAFTLAVAMFLFPTVSVDGVNELLMALSPTQTLWINLVASVALSIPLAFEVIEPKAMRRKPRHPDEPVFSGFIVFRLLMVAGLMAAGACGLFLWEYGRMAGPAPITAESHAFALAEAQSICVTTIVCFQIFYMLNCRSLKDSLLSLGVFSNPSVFVGIGVLLLLQACFLYLPPMQALFRSATLDWKAWLDAILVGATVLPVISVEKWLRGRKANLAP